MSHSHVVKGNWGSAVKTSAGYIEETLNQTSNCDSDQLDHPLKNMVDRGIFDSGCSGHMTGNKDQLEDFEEFNGNLYLLEVAKRPIYEDAELIVMPSAVKNTEEKVESRKSFTNSKKEEILTEP
ncbi:hypothetical protein Tco_1466448 [Tanacetum coccineum]